MVFVSNGVEYVRVIAPTGLRLTRVTTRRRLANRVFEVVLFRGLEATIHTYTFTNTLVHPRPKKWGKIPASLTMIV